MKLLLRLKFLGTDFCGWQYQPNARTVQGTLTAAAREVFGVDCCITGCSRTDSGVHANDFAATLELMRASDFMSSFSFCYSDRPGTRASRFLDKIAPDVQQDRLLRLQALQEELSQRWLDARVGQECEVLLENASRREATDDDSLQSWQGRDIYGALVHVPLPAGDHTGRLVNARIVEAKKHSLVAEATGQPW